MRAVLGILAALGILSWAGETAALDTYLRLDSGSFIHQQGPTTNEFYDFGPGAKIRLVFGTADRGVVPVSIPRGGLELGVAGASRLPPVEFSLVDPATGSFTVGNDGTGVLTMQASVLVKRLGGKRAFQYDVNVSADIVKSGSVGHVLLSVNGDVAERAGPTKDTFNVTLGGALDDLPPGL